MTRLSNAFGRLFDALAVVAALILLVMVVTVTADILLRNLTRTGFPWANEVSEYALYGMTLLTAPWLLRRGQHVRIDLLLAAVPPRAAWVMEAAGDLIGFLVCIVMVRYGTHMVADSFRLGSLTIKNLVFAEWWLLAPLPIAFALLAAEFAFRLHRLLTGAPGRRIEATSTSSIMDWVTASLILFGGLSIAMGVGVPVAIAFLMLDVIGAFFFLGGEVGLSQLARNSVASVTSFSLTPIPFFVLMGEVLFRTGLAIKAIDAIASLIHRVPGRLAVITIVAGTVFSAISGSTIATTAMLGSLMLPTMLARGYDPKMAMGPIMAIGSVDVLIPPSALAVLLGSLAGISISGLLIGGIVPGLILSVIFIGYIILRAHWNPTLAPEQAAADLPSGMARWRPFVVHVMPLVLIFAVVVGAMTRGWATPTEAAALGAAATIVAATLYRSLTFENLMTALKGTVAVSGTILFIIVGATTFAQVLSFSGATNGIISLVGAQGLPSWALILGMMGLLIFLGFFVDEVSMMMITLPFFMPLVTQMGVDPIWFGVLFLINMQIGLLSPPFGLLLFAMKGVAPPHITMGQIVQSVMPYLYFGVAVMLLVFLWPPLATWLPRLLGG